MQKKIDYLIKNIEEKLGQDIVSLKVSFDMITLEISNEKLLSVCKTLKNDKIFDFSQLIDLAGIDYFSFKEETISSLNSISTFSTIFITFASVTRNPLINFDTIFDLSSSLFILGPPP